MSCYHLFSKVLFWYNKPYVRNLFKKGITCDERSTNDLSILEIIYS